MRIRTIKPEFWQHEILAQLPEFTRLLAIGLLNYADDEGYFYASPQAIRGAVFPFLDDSRRIHGALTELSSVGYIVLGKSADGRAVGRVAKFEKHQVINRPRASVIGPFEPENTESVNNHGGFTDESVNNNGAVTPGMEGNGTGNGTGNREHEYAKVSIPGLEVEETEKPYQETDPIKLRLLKLYNRRTNKPMPPDELKAMRKADIQEEDLSAVEAYYADPHKEWNGGNFRRRDLITLLNNWQQEVDRATAWKAAGPIKIVKSEAEKRNAVRNLMAP